MTYEAFIGAKSQIGDRSGFEPLWLPDFLFPFQSHLTDWAVRKGCSALLEDCGLGKTIQELVWAENIVRKTNGRVLILTPLAVAPQFVDEGEKFGIEVFHSKDGRLKGKSIVANYERLHHFNSTDFDGVVCDEASILKNFDGATRKLVTEFMRKIAYRLAGTATAAPNDFIELGTLSEALGELGYMDMLARYFKNDQNSNHPNRLWAGGSKWRFRGHAEKDFWRWVCSWARAIRKPSDIGFDDNGFILPPLNIRQHVVQAKSRPDGFLIDLPAHTLNEQREERRRTLTERCEKAAQLIIENGGPSVAWCNLNPEGDLLEKLIPNCVQVSGADSIEEKEEKLEAFRLCKIQNLVSKGEITGFGCNWQHCAHQTQFPSHSYELFHQTIRRSWRFGQKRPVAIDVVTSEGQTNVLQNLQRKTKAADIMFARLVEHMRDELAVKNGHSFTLNEEIPSW